MIQVNCDKLFNSFKFSCDVSLNECIRCKTACTFIQHKDANSLTNSGGVANGKIKSKDCLTGTEKI